MNCKEWDEMNKFKVVDLFAGAGGLSLGFLQTNKFEIKAAVEKNKAAQTTYKNNIRNADIYEDIKDVDFNEMKNRYGSIDVVIGGPPCQGFSNANRQHNQAINLNNKLVKEYVRSILQLHPKAFVMENVGMLKSEVHRFYVEKEEKDLILDYQIPVKDSKIHLLKKQWYFPDVLSILNFEESIAANLWDEKLYQEINILYKNRKNEKKLRDAFEKHFNRLKNLISNRRIAENAYIRSKNEALFKELLYSYGNLDLERIINNLSEPIAIQKMLLHAKEIYSNHIEANFTLGDGEVVAEVRSCAVYDYLTRTLGDNRNGYAINQGILSAYDFGVPQRRKRFIIMGVRKEISEAVELPQPLELIPHYTVYDAIADLENIWPYSSVEEDNDNNGKQISPDALKAVANLKSLRNGDGHIYNHIIPVTRKNALERFKALHQGQNFHDLEDSLKENTYTSASRTQNTVYCRLNYSEPSGTVVNVRKSMWIHPVLDRAVSIREAARLQSFPDSFRFYGTKDSQYQQVGNAVPPMLAEAIARKLLTYLE